TAAQAYDSIAPWVPHALHMPSHIFTRLGMWDESIAANRASVEASRAYAAMRHRDATEAEELHALDYMAYSYLQEARDAEAKEIARMQQLRDATKDPKFDYFKSHLDLQMQAASARVAAAEGKKDEAIDLLRRAADSEDILGKHPVSPGAFVPIREQLGTLLLEVGQAKQAQREFEAALKIYPGRFRGLYGAALAAEQAGDKQNASRYYAKLAAQTTKSDGSRDELNHVREFLAAQTKAPNSTYLANSRG